MKFLRVALLLTFACVSFGCGGGDTPEMLGKEALENLPPDPEIKQSPKVKRIKAEGPAGAGTGDAEGMELK